MKKIEILKAACIEKKVQFEEQETMFGIKAKNVWNWFRYYDRGDFLMFDHSYSQNTGRVKKGLMHRIRTQASIEKKLNIAL